MVIVSIFIYATTQRFITGFQNSFLYISFAKVQEQDHSIFNDHLVSVPRKEMRNDLRTIATLQVAGNNPTSRETVKRSVTLNMSK